MNAQWQQRAKRIDALSLRERAFLFLSASMVIAALADTLVLSPALAGQGAWTLLPQDWHTPLEQAVVQMRRSAAQPLAAQVLRHLGTPEMSALMRRFGFALPAAAGPTTP